MCATPISFFKNLMCHLHGYFCFLKFHILSYQLCHLHGLKVNFKAQSGREHNSPFFKGTVKVSSLMPIITNRGEDKNFPRIWSALFIHQCILTVIVKMLPQGSKSNTYVITQKQYVHEELKKTSTRRKGQG